ncbi:threonine synthase [Thermovirga sp.]|uniref:threonine synthase n=1 Tax=Thermovirga sp. TaxID=2699834 RepID=UPI0025EC907B|nr:threonine synthase [Thermovirga sp.]
MVILKMKFRVYCPECGKNYEPQLRPPRCVCGKPLSSTTDWQALDIDPSKRGMFRYFQALPLVDEDLSMGEGWTPLIPALGRDNLFFKLEFLCPTGSFKDRGAVMVVADAVNACCDSVVIDSSGNAGASVAAYSARARIKAYVVVPKGTSEGKKKQIAAFGAEVIEVPGGRSEAAKKAMGMAEKFFYASHVWNPLFIEGTKTVAFEIWEQLGEMAPDAVLSPAGNGTMLLGLYKGFKELMQRGLARRMPKIFAVQSERCNPLYSAFYKQGKRIGKTLAEGIAVAEPPRLNEMLSAVRSTGGGVLTVSEEEIASEQSRLAKEEGLLVEPTAAVAPAAEALLREMGLLDSKDLVVVPLTGSGMKKPPE